jgi:hypothetical protein
MYRQVPNVRPPWVLHFTRRHYHKPLVLNLKPVGLRLAPEGNINLPQLHLLD